MPARLLRDRVRDQPVDGPRGRQRPGRVASPVAGPARHAGRPRRGGRADGRRSRACPTWSSRPTRAWSTATSSSARGSATGSARGRRRTSTAGPGRTGFEVETLPPGHNFEGAGDALFCGADPLRRLSVPERRPEPPLDRRAAGRAGPPPGAGRPPVLSPRHLLLPARRGRRHLLPGGLRRLRPVGPGRADRHA